MTGNTAPPIPVIFDMDGVLVDSEPLHLEVEDNIYEELGIDLSREEHYRFVGMVPQQIWSVLRERYGLADDAETLRLKEEDRKYEIFRQKEVPLVPGVEVLLGHLRRDGHSMALASSSPRRIIELFTSKTNTASYFDFLLSGEEVPNGKPAPDIFLEAARRLEAPPASCVVIEDSRNGVLAAKAAGMRCIGYQNPLSGKQDLQAADLVVSDFERERDEILEFIRAHSS